MLNQEPFSTNQTNVPRRRLHVREKLLILLLIAVIGVVAYFKSGIPYWLKTNPQYNGTVSIVEVGSQHDAGFLEEGGIGYPTLIENEETTLPYSVVHPSISADIANKPELQYPYITYGDLLGNVYIVVEERKYEMFTKEICKIYKVEDKNLSRVRDIPEDLWCFTLVTDYKGNWLTSAMTHDGGETDMIYKIEGTRGLYVAEFKDIGLSKFFYNDEDGSLYAVSRTVTTCPTCVVKKYLKVTFTP